MPRSRASNVTTIHADGTVSISSAYNRVALGRIVNGISLRPCEATTKAGSCCGIPATRGKSVCHVHDPDTRHRRRHPRRAKRRRLEGVDFTTYRRPEARP